MIESRWRLRSLSVRDAAANDLSLALDFSDPDFDAPDYDVAPFVPTRCP